MRILESITLMHGTRVQLAHVTRGDASAYVVRVIRNGEITDASFGARRFAYAAYMRITQSVRETV